MFHQIGAHSFIDFSSQIGNSDSMTLNSNQLKKAAMGREFRLIFRYLCQLAAEHTNQRRSALTESDAVRKYAHLQKLLMHFFTGLDRSLSPLSAIGLMILSSTVVNSVFMPKISSPVRLGMIFCLKSSAQLIVFESCPT
jgi:hypothetical protein